MAREPKEHLTLKELMQIRESLDRLWPDLEQTGKRFKFEEKLEKLARHLPDWFVFFGFIIGVALGAYFPYSKFLQFISSMLIMLFVFVISYRQGFERGSIRGFKDALASVQTAIDQENLLEEG